jgi:hypothetical protein
MYLAIQLLPSQFFLIALPVASTSPNNNADVSQQRGLTMNIIFHIQEKKLPGSFLFASLFILKKLVQPQASKFIMVPVA